LALRKGASNAIKWFAFEPAIITQVCGVICDTGNVRRESAADKGRPKMAKGQQRSNREAKKPKKDAKLKKTGPVGMPDNINPFGSGKKGGVAPHKSGAPKR
jgi:hypothetical protein